MLVPRRVCTLICSFVWVVILGCGLAPRPTAEPGFGLALTPGMGIGVVTTTLGGLVPRSRVDSDTPGGGMLVTVDSVRPGESVTVSWRSTTEREIPPKGPTPVVGIGTPAPTPRTQAVTEGGSITANRLIDAHATLLPIYWPSFEATTTDTSLMWLSQDAFEELKRTRQTRWSADTVVYHKRWTPANGWEPAVRVNGEIVGGSWGDAAISPDGLAHIVWGNEFADVKHYVRQRSDGSWSQPRPITDETVTDVRLAIDSYGSRHFVWRGPDDSLYHVALPPATLAELGGVEGKIVVTTDKAEYDAGEVIGISVTNNLDVPIWYAQELECGLSFWLLERCEPREIIEPKVPCVWAEAQHDFTQLAPGETLASEWSGTLEILGDSGIVEKAAEPGCYRIQFPFSLSPLLASWGRDRMEVYSDEFRLK